MKKSLVVALFLFALSPLRAQSFEGWVEYKVQMKNPNPEMISDEDWKQVIRQSVGPDGFMFRRGFYSGESYVTEIRSEQQSGFIAYNPKDKLIYNWQEGSSSAVTLDSEVSMDALLEIVELDTTATIMGIDCKAIVLKSQMMDMIVWYNPDVLPMEKSLYEGHLYGHREALLAYTGSLPLKVELIGPMLNIVQTCVAYQETHVDGSIFELPHFEDITADPVN